MFTNLDVSYNTLLWCTLILGMFVGGLVIWFWWCFSSSNIQIAQEFISDRLIVRSDMDTERENQRLREQIPELEKHVKYWKKQTELWMPKEDKEDKEDKEVISEEIPIMIYEDNIYSNHLDISIQEFDFWHCT